MKVSSSLRILIVDDCIDTRNFIKQILLKKGFKNVLSVSDGERAIEVLNESYTAFEPVGVILADWQMPNVDGLQLLSRVRLDDRFKDVPFIMVTSDRERDHVIQALNVGVDSYIVKPIKGDVLLEKLTASLVRT
ncbi:response regulator [Halobacteriovorax sp. GB3]|uniref:response regulator n=1 Tax=Halobacteriovorax sp. GB3 TaxID=2719615 RepID=UPI0023629B58|nr:response regulator [Halobacteriovorax sp. GB3]MDD0853235.1 response regulator [Halobacteriovorax sp. GB3]